MKYIFAEKAICVLGGIVEKSYLTINSQNPKIREDYQKFLDKIYKLFTKEKQSDWHCNSHLKHWMLENGRITSTKFFWKWKWRNECKLRIIHSAQTAFTVKVK